MIDDEWIQNTKTVEGKSVRGVSSTPVAGKERQTGGKESMISVPTGPGDNISVVLGKYSCVKIWWNG